MKVNLNMEGATISLGNRGVTLAIADNDGKHVGNLRIGRATVEWRKGKVRDGNCKQLKLSDLIAILYEL